MDHQGPKKVPVIDMNEENLKPGAESRIRARNDVRRALEEYGCFVALYDKISSELKEKIFRAMPELFGLPKEVKLLNAYDIPFLGYLEMPGQPLLEGMGLKHATYPETIENFCKIIWFPDGNDYFRDIVFQYANLVSELEKSVMRLVFESYGFPDEERDYHVDNTTYMVRFNKYEVPGPGQSHLAAVQHTDEGFLSIIGQNQMNGLEIKLKNDQWIGVDILPSSFAVLAGEGITAWSNGKVRPVFHRVMMNSTETRYSFGQFSYQKGIVKVREEMIDEEHPQRYNSFDHLGLLLFHGVRAKRGIYSTESTLTEYCGI